MASFFNVGSLGNVFSTPVGQRIEQATDASLPSESWSLNMEICDMINESSDTARDAMRAIRKRLIQNAGKNNQVIMYTLIVLETCVKNCGKAFHMLVAQKDFINELVKLIGPKNDPPAIVQEKVLSLIQSWADAFKNQSDLNGVTQMYMELKNKGIEFPPADLEALAPIFTPERSVPQMPAQHCVQQTLSPQRVSMVPATGNVVGGNGPLSLTPEQTAKLKAELEIVQNNMSILNEMLSVLKPDQEEADDYVLLNELTATCKEMQARIVDLIGRVIDDELTAEFLRINDELNNLFLRHQRYEKTRTNNALTSPSAVLGAALGVPAAATPAVVATTTTTTATTGGLAATQPANDQLLIDLIESTEQKLPNNFNQLAIGAGSGGITGVSPAANAVVSRSGVQSKDADEFDILAQSRTDGINQKNDLLRDIPTVDATAGSMSSQYKHSAGEPPVVSKSTKENEIDEMEAWLGSSKDIDGIEEITSSEFDKFLEERAAAAENLPNINAATTAPATAAITTANAEQMKRQQKKSGDEDLLAL